MLYNNALVRPLQSFPHPIHLIAALYSPLPSLPSLTHSPARLSRVSDSPPRNEAGQRRMPRLEQAGQPRRAAAAAGDNTCAAPARLSLAADCKRQRPCQSLGHDR